MVFFSIFVFILTRALPKRTLFSIFALILTNALPKSVFFSLYLCPFSNQSPVTKGVFSIFAHILAKAPPRRVFYSIFALILTKALPKTVYSNPIQNPDSKVVFLYFCPYSMWGMLYSFAALSLASYFLLTECKHSSIHHGRRPFGVLNSVLVLNLLRGQRNTHKKTVIKMCSLMEKSLAIIYNGVSHR